MYELHCVFAHELVFCTSELITPEYRLTVGDFVHSIGDSHIYSKHIKQVQEQPAREPKLFPILRINPNKRSIYDIELEDLTTEGYNPHPAIKASVAV